MALTNELIAQDETLKTLTPEQVTAITTLSERDENAVIGRRLGEIYREFDGHIETVTGIKRDGDEKTYNYFTRAMGAYKTEAEQATVYKGQIETLTKERDNLQKAVNEGATDKEVAKRLATVSAELDNTKKQYNELNEKFTGQTTAHQKEIFDLRVGSVIGQALAGFKFKETVPEAVRTVLVEQAVNKVKGMNPDFIEADGVQTLVFKDAAGAPLANPANRLAYYTAAELIEKELKTMDILDAGRQAAGTGTGQPAPGSGTGAGASTVVSIEGATTQVQAYEQIASALFARGLKNTDPEFSDEMGKAWKDLNVSDLPTK